MRMVRSALGSTLGTVYQRMVEAGILRFGESNGIATSGCLFVGAVSVSCVVAVSVAFASMVGVIVAVGVVVTLTVTVAVIVAVELKVASRVGDNVGVGVSSMVALGVGVRLAGLAPGFPPETFPGGS